MIAVSLIINTCKWDCDNLMCTRWRYWPLLMRWPWLCCEQDGNGTDDCAYASAGNDHPRLSFSKGDDDHLPVTLVSNDHSCEYDLSDQYHKLWSQFVIHNRW